MPLQKRPDHYHLSPLLGGATRERAWLAFHRGRVRQGCGYHACMRACVCMQAVRGVSGWMLGEGQGAGRSTGAGGRSPLMGG